MQAFLCDLIVYGNCKHEFEIVKVKQFPVYHIEIFSLEVWRHGGAVLMIFFPVIVSWTIFLCSNYNISLIHKNAVSQWRTQEMIQVPLTLMGCLSKFLWWLGRATVVSPADGSSIMKTKCAYILTLSLLSLHGYPMAANHRWHRECILWKFDILKFICLDPSRVYWLQMWSMSRC